MSALKACNGESANRYYAGIDLAMAGKAKIIVFSTGEAPWQGAIMRQIAISRGVQADRVVVTHVVLSTEDEARAVSEIPGIHSILLVTSAFHMPRAVLLFRARGLDVFPFPTDGRIFVRQNLTPFSFIPASGPLGDSEQALQESTTVWVSIVRSSLFGRLRSTTRPVAFSSVRVSLIHETV